MKSNPRIIKPKVNTTVMYNANYETSILHESKNAASQTNIIIPSSKNIPAERPTTLNFEAEMKQKKVKSRNRSRSFDVSQKNRKHSSFDRLHKLKKLLSSNPEINDRKDLESAPLVSETTCGISRRQSASTTSSLSPASPVKHLNKHTLFGTSQQAQSDLNLTDTLEMSPNFGLRNMKYECLSLRDNLSSPDDRIRNRIRTMSECTDCSTSLMGSRIVTVSSLSLNSQHSHLERQNAMNSQENISDIFCDPENKI